MLSEIQKCSNLQIPIDILLYLISHIDKLNYIIYSIKENDFNKSLWNWNQKVCLFLKLIKAPFCLRNINKL